MQLEEIAAYKRLPLDIVGAEGHELLLRDGGRVLDLYGGHCVNVLGAGHAGLGQVIQKQWSSISFATNLLEHPTRAAFLQALGQNLPQTSQGWRVFVSNSGSEANENALKCAIASTGRNKVLVMQGAFHGRTAAAAFASDTQNQGFPHSPIAFVRVPWNDLKATEAALDDTFAAILVEPIQSMAGVRTPDSRYLQGLQDLAGRCGAALIFDEVQTGSGRLGSHWAAEHFGVVPDIITSAKGAGGGFPIGLTVARTDLLDHVPGNLFGSTFGGGPLALAAATYVAQTVGDDEFLAQVRATAEGLRAIAHRGPFEGAVGAGLLLGFRVSAPASAAEVRDRLLKQGVLVGTCNDPQIVRLSPPLTLGQTEVTRFQQAVEQL